MDASEFVWNKKLTANIGKMSEIAGEYMTQFPEGELIPETLIHPEDGQALTGEYDPSAPLKPNWDAIMDAGKSELKQYVPPANEFTEDEVHKLKLLAVASEAKGKLEKVEHGASTVKALVKDAVQAAVGFLGEVGIYVKDMDANMHPGEIPTVTLVLDALGPVKNVKQGYLTVAALIEAVHEVKK